MEDQSERVRALQPETAEPGSGHDTLSPGLHCTLEQKESDLPLDLQQLAQEATTVANQPNGVEVHGTLKASLNTSIDATVDKAHYLLQHDSQGERVLPARESPTASLTALAGDPVTVDAKNQDIKPSPDLNYDMPLPNDTILFGAADPYSDGSSAISQADLAASLADEEEHQIQAYAKLEFDDGEFYMMTYAVELGRDIHAARQAFERKLELRDGTSSKSRRHTPSNGSGSIMSDGVKQENGHTLVNGLASEGGGVVAEHHGLQLLRKLRRKKSRSSGTSSQRLSRKSSMQYPVSRVDYNQLAMDELMDRSGIDSFGPDLMPPPDVVPLIPIHPPQLTDGVGAHKSISRKHIRIAFNFERHLFEVEVIGRNGCYVNNNFYFPEDVVELHNGSILQIGGVGVRFVLPDVPEGATGAEIGEGLDPLSGGKMSFDMADSNDDDGEDEDDMEAEDEGKEQNESEPEMVSTRAKAKKRSEPAPTPTRRKGPGRPPKNGIISKREQALLTKQAREDAKSGRRKASGAIDGRGKGKTAKEVHVKKQDENLQPNGKRKYTKRKRAGGSDDQHGIRESTEHTDSAPPEQALAAALPPKPAKDKKPPKPPRSPSPVYDESTMTPEQLAKPQSSYVILIHEALTNSKTGAMSLPQIYRAIERRYPFYKLRVQTQGWQSSVRHNLSQHPAFQKIERDGKGWMWGLVPEVSIEKEKKRRATPPPASQQHYYPQGPPPMMQHPGYPYPGMPSQNGQMPPAPYNMRPGMPMPFPAPPYGRPPLPLPLVNPQSESTYQSPYQSTPPPASQPNQQAQQSGNTNTYVGPYAPSQPPGPQSSNTNGTSSTHQQQVQAPPATNGTSNSDHDSPPNVKQAMATFKASLISKMDDKVYGEKLVTSAINRALNLQNVSSLPGGEDPQEQKIMTAFSKMIADLSTKNLEAKQRASGTFVPQPSKPDQSLEGEKNTSSDPSAVSKVTENPATSVLANGHTTPSKAAEPNKPQSGTKRPLENGDEDEAYDSEQPKAKRVALAAD